MLSCVSGQLQFKANSDHCVESCHQKVSRPLPDIISGKSRRKKKLLVTCILKKTPFKFPYSESDRGSIVVSLVHSDCHWISMVSGGGLSHHLITDPVNKRCYEMELKTYYYIQTMTMNF